MSNLGIWHIKNGLPDRLQRKPLDLEKHLEEWIEQDISLVNPDLIVVGRQIHVETGIIDLLAVEQFGNYWAIIEIKRGRVTDETVAQAMRYLASLDQLSSADLKDKIDNYLLKRKQTIDFDDTAFDPDNREIVIYVVGTGRDDNLDLVASMLNRNTNFSVNVVTFDTFEDSNSNWTLARQLDEIEDTTSSVLASQPVLTKSDGRKPITTNDEKHEAVRDRAYKNGIGEAFDIIHEAASKHGLYTRYYKGLKSTMYASPADKRRYLIFAPVVKKDGRYSFWFSAQAFAEFYPVGEFQVRRILGLTSNQFDFTVENAQKLADNLDRLFEIIEKNS